MINWEELKVGDKVKIRYTSKGQFCGGTIEGKITELILGETSEERNKKGHEKDKYIGKLWQGQVDNGWCFHSKDEIVYHITQV